MTEIKYIQADVCNPIGTDNKFICHIVNDLGAMGAGVALALLKKWSQVRSDYIAWSKAEEIDPIDPKLFNLGNIQTVKVEKDIIVVNMVGQTGTISNPVSDAPPVRYSAVCQCLDKVAILAKKNNASVHLPYLMGCDLAGGKWHKVEKIIKECLCDQDIEVIVYDLFGKRS